MASTDAHGHERKNGMQVTQTLNEGLKRGYRIVVPGTDLTEKVEARLVEEQPNLQLNGFRKGKVPIVLMRRLFGKEIDRDVRQIAVEEALRTHFSDSGEKPAMFPDIEVGSDAMKEGADLSFDVAYEALPVIPEVDFRSIKLERLVVKATEEEIQKLLDEHARQFGSHEDAEAGATAEMGDLLTLDFKGLIDGEEFEAGSGEGFPVLLGSDLIAPGLDEQLIGVEVEAEVEAKVTYPEDYHIEELQAKEARFSCTVRELMKMKPSQIDDSLAAKVGFENLEDLERKIRESVESQLAKDARLVLRFQLLDRISEMVDFELPSVLLKNEADSVARQLTEDAQRQSDENEDLDDDEIGDDIAVEPTPEHIGIAERRLRLGLLFGEVGNANDIAVNDHDLRLAAEQMAARVPAASRQRYLELFYGNEEIRSRFEQRIFEDKVIEFLLELIEVTDREVSRDELREAIEAIDE